MNCNDVKPGMRVRVATLNKTTGMMIAPAHLDCRRAGATGTVHVWVPGHGGDVWFVKHDGSDEVAAYSFDELQPEP